MGPQRTKRARGGGRMDGNGKLSCCWPSRTFGCDAFADGSRSQLPPASAACPTRFAMLSSRDATNKAVNDDGMSRTCLLEQR